MIQDKITRIVSYNSKQNDHLDSEHNDNQESDPFKFNELYQSNFDKGIDFSPPEEPVYQNGHHQYDTEDDDDDKYFECKNDNSDCDKPYKDSPLKVGENSVGR